MLCVSEEYLSGNQWQLGYCLLFRDNHGSQYCIVWALLQNGPSKSKQLIKSCMVHSKFTIPGNRKQYILACSSESRALCCW